MAGLGIRLLGAPRIERDETPIDVDTRKATALLAYLAVTRAPQHRDTLATLLWPEADGTRARNALRRTLSVLVRALDGRWLGTSRDLIELRFDETVWCDVIEFRSLTASPDQIHGHDPLTRAARLYNDDFMAGFTLRDSPAFDEWQRFQADGLRDELAHVLESLVTHDIDVGDLPNAIAHARRWLALNPLNEATHRQLMQLYASSGDRSAALQQYRACVRILDSELGVAPLEETTALYRDIRERQQLPMPQAPTRSVTPPRPAHAHPFVGRQSELRQIAEAYRRAASGVRIVVIEGEAGIGKTRLIETALQPVLTRGSHQLTMRCYEGESQMALRPVADLLRAAIGRPGKPTGIAELPAYVLSDASRLLPHLSELQQGLPAPEPLDSSVAQTRFFDALVEIIRVLLEGATPGVLVIEDAHWIDSATLDFAGYLVRRLASHPILILFSIRPEALDDGHRLPRMLARLGRQCETTTLHLERLPLADVERLAAVVTGADGARPTAIAERLYRETQGLPFFVIEYLNQLSEHADLGEGVGWPLPGGVRDLLRSRMSTVRPVEAQLLATLATVGRACTFDLLATSSGQTDDETADGLDGLLESGLAVEIGGDTIHEPLYDVGHAKLREMIYEGMSRVRRRLLHRRIAEALGEQRANRPLLMAQIAHHYRCAGLDALAAAAFVEAGDTAREMFANAEAVAHYDAALALGYPEPALLDERIADVLVPLGGYERALAAYQSALAGVEPCRAAAIERKLGRLYHRLGEWERAERHFESARVASTDDASNRSSATARLLADWSLTAHRRGDAERALDLARQALEQATTSNDQRVMAQIHNLLGILARADSDLSIARSELEASLRLATAVGDDGIRVAALNNLALVEHASGNFDGAIAVTNEALALCARLGDRHREAALHSNLADALHASGRRDEALEHLRRSATLYAEIGVVAGEPYPEIWKLIEWTS